MPCLVILGSGKSEELEKKDNRLVSSKDLFSKTMNMLAEAETVHKGLRLFLDAKVPLHPEFLDLSKILDKS